MPRWWCRFCFSLQRLAGGVECLWKGNTMWAASLTCNRPLGSIPALISPSISSTNPIGSTTTPLPMTQVVRLGRIPDGIRCRMLGADDDSVPGVGSALGADDNVRLLGHEIDDLPCLRRPIGRPLEWCSTFAAVCSRKARTKSGFLISSETLWKQKTGVNAWPR